MCSDSWAIWLHLSPSPSNSEGIITEWMFSRTSQFTVVVGDSSPTCPGCSFAVFEQPGQREQCDTKLTHRTHLVCVWQDDRWIKTGRHRHKLTFWVRLYSNLKTSPSIIPVKSEINAFMDSRYFFSNQAFAEFSELNSSVDLLLYRLSGSLFLLLCCECPKLEQLNSVCLHQSNLSCDFIG